MPITKINIATVGIDNRIVAAALRFTAARGRMLDARTKRDEARSDFRCTGPVYHSCPIVHVDRIDRWCPGCKAFNPFRIALQNAEEKFKAAEKVLVKTCKERPVRKS